jgi:hydroxyacylglutathione hydrolase
VELLHRVIGPASTNLYVIGDEATREAIAIDAATPCVGWVSEALRTRGWRLRLIVSTHGHWDHIGDNAALQAWSAEQAEHLAEHAARMEPRRAAEIAVHPLDRERLLHPKPLFAPFEIVPSVPAVDLAEGGRIRFGSIDLEVLHTPGHTEGSVCLLARDAGLVLTGDTLFAGGWGRVDLPGGSADQMVASIRRLRTLQPSLRVLPGHGPATNVGREAAWMDLVAEQGRLFA